MSEEVVITEAPREKSFLAHAKLISGFTLISRVLGLAREVVAGHYLGTGVVASAFTVAFTIPNLFRKLLGEGALSAAFIPLYAQASRRGTTDSGEPAADFASRSVNLLLLMLLAITLIGEIILGSCIFLSSGDRPDRLMMLRFACIMLPYVMLVCGGAFLSAILQVHKRFGPPAFAPVLLNVCHIAVIVIGAWMLGLHGRDPLTARTIELQATLAYALAATVLVAGAMQVAILVPALRAVGFRFRPTLGAWTASTQRMLRLSIPVALGAGVLQISVLLDKGISYALMQGVDRSGALVTHFDFAGQSIRYPLELGATRRLDLAQLLYQFPLGVFAIALATAIFPTLSADALERDNAKFKRVLRQGIEASMWEGLPASAGMILIAPAAVMLLFQHGQITSHDTELIVRSTCWYAGAIWAFSVLQVINRAFYAIHDTTTPLVASVVNIALNLIIEIPLLWWVGEAGMAIGTLVSFIIQAIFMLWMLNRRIGGMDLRPTLIRIAKMLIATAVMIAICLMARAIPGYPQPTSRFGASMDLVIMLILGIASYFGACAVFRVDTLKQLLRKA